MAPLVECHSCRQPLAEAAIIHERLPRVSSDCRPSPKSGRLAVCSSCGLAQTTVNDGWHQAAADVYDDYKIYAAAEGAEQKVAAEAGLCGRSQVLVDRWVGEGSLRDAGCLLDVGCGNGSFLRAFSGRFPEWDLYGVETSDRYLPQLRRMPKFRDFFLVENGEIEGSFDAISLIHVLEHLADPASHLASLRNKAKAGAELFVEVPGWLDNPFALMIADHASHFTSDTLRMIVQRSRWSPVASSPSWVPKELSLIATNRNAPHADSASVDGKAALGQLQDAVDWLSAVVHQAREVAAQSRHFGLFGTAIAATWLYQSLSDKIEFFVDEDPDRVGRTHLGLPILAPSEVPDGSDVFVGVSPLLSGKIASRLARAGCLYHVVAR